MRHSVLPFAIGLAIFLPLLSQGCGGSTKTRSNDAAMATDLPLGQGGSSGADWSPEVAEAPIVGSGGIAGTGGTTSAGGTTSDGGGLGQDGAADTTAEDAGTAGDGPSCGDRVCNAGQLCVHPTCASGTAPPCVQPMDGGACPAGLVYSQTCGLPSYLGRPPGCTYPPCVDPPPFCIDIPAACGAKPSCACLPYNVCLTNGGSMGGTCGLLSQSVVTCLSG